MLGGHTEDKTDAEGLAQCAAFQGIVEAKAGSTFATFEVKRYTTQVVSGTNYTFEVHVGEEKHIAVRVYEPLPHTNDPAQVSEFKVDHAVGAAFDF